MEGLKWWNRGGKGREEGRKGRDVSEWRVEDGKKWSRGSWSGRTRRLRTGVRRQTGGLDREEEEGIESKEGRREDGTTGAGKNSFSLVHYKGADLSYHCNRHSQYVSLIHVLILIPNQIIHDGIGRRKSAGTRSSEGGLSQIIGVHNNPKEREGGGRNCDVVSCELWSEEAM
jgi:hypothetical protein